MDIGGQILAHLVGDFLLQSAWMAKGKMQRWPEALVHGACYTLPFLLITQSWWKLLIIGLSHAVFDRLRLSWYIVWAKGFLAPPRHWPKRSELWTLEEVSWLRIVTDNTCHMLINALVLSL